MTKELNPRDYFAAHAPITFDDVCNAFGSRPNLNQDDERAAFFAVWVFLRMEYANAMLDAREPKPSNGFPSPESQSVALETDQKENIAAFIRRYEQDRAGEMTEKQWLNWMNTLTENEFSGLISIPAERKSW